MKITLTKYKNLSKSFFAISVEGKPRIPKEMTIPIIGIFGLIFQNLFLK